MSVADPGFDLSRGGGVDFVPIPIMYLVFISIIFQPNLILVTSPIAPVTRNSTLLVNT